MKGIFGSQNALVSAITILLGVFFALLRANGLNVPEDAAEATIDAIQRVDIIQIVSVIFPSVLLPVFKFVKNGFPSFVKTFKSSDNFRTQLTVGLVGMFGLAGIVLDVAGINDFLGQIASITALNAATVISLAAALLHAINSGVHITQTAKGLNAK